MLLFSKINYTTLIIMKISYIFFLICLINYTFAIDDSCEEIIIIKKEKATDTIIEEPKNKVIFYDNKSIDDVENEINKASTKFKLIVMQNNLNAEKTEYLVDLIKNKKIFLLKITGCKIKKDHIKNIFDAIKKNETITDFSFQKNNLEDMDSIKHLINSIYYNDHIKNITLSGLKIKNCGMEIIGKKLMISKKIKKLIIGDNELEKGGMKYIFDSICINNYITLLDVGFNDISGSSSYLSKMIIKNYNLRVLNISGIFTTKEEVNEIIKSLKKNKSIEVLTINSSKILSNMMSEFCKLIEENIALKSIIIRNNNIGDKEIKKICKSLKKNNSIEKIDLFGNRITSKGLELLKNSINSKNFKCINIGENNICQKGLKTILKITNKHPSIYEFYFEGNNFKNLSLNYKMKSIFIGKKRAFKVNKNKFEEQLEIIRETIEKRQKIIQSKKTMQKRQEKVEGIKKLYYKLFFLLKN